MPGEKYADEHAGEGVEGMPSTLHVGARATTVAPDARLSTNVKDPAVGPANVISASAMNDLSSPRHVAATSKAYGWTYICVLVPLPPLALPVRPKCAIICAVYFRDRRCSCGHAVGVR